MQVPIQSPKPTEHPSMSISSLPSANQHMITGPSVSDTPTTDSVASDEDGTTLLVPDENFSTWRPGASAAKNLRSRWTTKHRLEHRSRRVESTVPFTSGQLPTSAEIEALDLEVDAEEEVARELHSQCDL